jgi:uncharacterized membrane protein YoaK (UPF0700 family)
MAVKKVGALVDRHPDDVLKTAKKSAKIFGNEIFGSIILSTVAGYVDTAGFMTLFGLFTAHVTGDLITAASTIFEGPQQGAYIRLAMIPIFMLTIAVITLFARAIRKRGAATLAPLLSIMTVLMALFCASGVYFKDSITNPDSWIVALIGGLGVAAMGIQNALMKGALRNFSQTTIMTGNLTQFTIDLVEYMFPLKHETERERKKMRNIAAGHVKKSGFPLLGFMIGAGLGALLTLKFGLLSIALPTFILAILSITAWFRTGKR